MPSPASQAASPVLRPAAHQTRRTGAAHAHPAERQDGAEGKSWWHTARQGSYPPSWRQGQGRVLQRVPEEAFWAEGTEDQSLPAASFAPQLLKEVLELTQVATPQGPRYTIKPLDDQLNFDKGMRQLKEGSVVPSLLQGL